MTSGTDPTPWLNSTEMRVWRAWLRVTVGVEQRITDGLKSSSSMTLDDYEVLVHLSEQPERRLRMSDLGARLVHSQSRLTQRIDRLSARGWVVREKCPDDGRGTLAVLTDDGYAALAAAAPDHVRDVRAALIDHIRSDELDVMAEVLERVADRNLSD